MALSFEVNQEVANPACPQWGVGKVLSIESTNGGNVQRIRVNFAGVGAKTLMIPPGRLIVSQGQDPANSTLMEGEDEEAMAARLQAIPEVIGDRQAGFDVRLNEVVGLYRFSGDRRDIFDWAAWQLGTRDPLGYFSADDLDLYFSNFSRSRDRVLIQLYQEACRTGLRDRFLSELKNKTTEKIYLRIWEVLENQQSNPNRVGNERRKVRSYSRRDLFRE